jgi:hypothetical protein
MSSIDYSRFALVLQRCKEIVADTTAAAQIRASYREVLEESAEAYLVAHDKATKAEHQFERQNAHFGEAFKALEPSYCSSRLVVKEHFPDAGLPGSLDELTTLFDKASAVETLLNILDDTFIDEAWAALEINSGFGRKAPALVRELGEAVVASAPFVTTLDARAVAYGPAFERHLVFKRMVRQLAGPHSGQYQSIHWRVAWGKEGAGPVSWGPFSFRAPFRTW